MTRFRAFLKDLLLYFRAVFSNEKGPSVLMYHSVGENSAFFTVKTGDFAWQMAYLKKKRFNVVSLEKILRSVSAGEKLPPRTVAITFDDGFSDNYSNAFPLLKRNNFPATIFLKTGSMGRSGINSEGVKFDMLSEKQIREMNKSGLIDFEPHTVSHPKLSKLDTGDAVRELSISKQAVENLTGRRCEVFAYPYGDYNQKVKDLVKKYYKGAVSVEKGFVSLSSDVFSLPRNAIDSLVGKLRFKLRV